MSGVAEASRLVGVGADRPADWNLFHRIAFRLVFSYLVLYNLPFPLGSIPGTESVATAVQRLWEIMVPWVGAHVLHLPAPINVISNGSGDKLFDYVLTLCFAALAVMITVAWSVLRSGAKEHDRLREWLRVLVRYVLFVTMVSYGGYKIIKLQFPDLSLGRLIQPLGDTSPMGLLWSFMGFSTAYTFFAGASEALGGLLLLFRRTTTLGAMVLCAVMSNVVLLNFCYDVPVKLYSVHLLLMAVWLLLPDLRRLADVLIFNRPTTPARITPLVANRRAQQAGRALTGLFAVSIVVMMTNGALESYKTYGPGAPKGPLDGFYEVVEFTRDGQTLPPLLTESTRWRKVAIGQGGRFTVRLVDDSHVRYGVELDPAKNTMQMQALDAERKDPLTYARSSDGGLHIQGTLQGHTLELSLRQIPERSFVLTSRGFHWVNEIPFNP